MPPPIPPSSPGFTLISFSEDWSCVPGLVDEALGSDAWDGDRGNMRLIMKMLD